MRQILLSQIQGEITICPYCGDEKHGQIGCCGESSCHFEQAYDLGDETLSVNECDVIDDRLLGKKISDYIWEHKFRIKNICRTSPCNPTRLEKYLYRAKRILFGFHKVPFNFNGKL